MSGKLYIVPTPVGNLSDITIRALEVLKSSDFIYCEDTRTSSVFLNHYDINAPRRSFHKFNEKSKVEEIINLIESGHIISVISDAGTPGISDPCSILVHEISPEFVSTLPGPTAFVPALVNSGLDTSEFKFIGFLPPKKNERIKKLKSLVDETSTLIFYESPHRIAEMLEDLEEIFYGRNAAIVREISKVFEETKRFNLSKIDFDPKDLKGEMVVLVEGAEKKELDIYPFVDGMIDKGETPKSILKEIKKMFPDADIKRNDIYDYVLEKRK